MNTYDEKYFKAKANRRAGTTWLTLMVIITIYYAAKMSTGDIYRAMSVANPAPVTPIASKPKWP